MSVIEPIRLIARYSLVKLVASFIAHCGLILTLYLPFFLGAPLEYIRSRSNWSVIILLAWIGGVFYLLSYIAFLWQVIVRRGVAVWIERGSIIYLHPKFLSATAADIKSASADSYNFGGMPMGLIRLEMKSGQVKSIPTSYLSESIDEVISRINQAVPSEN